jgi:hypothetical protein
MSINVVAVDVDPIIWAVQCDLCNRYVSDSTEDGDLADELYRAHCKVHGLPDESGE